jgi:hypothetical protein
VALLQQWAGAGSTAPVRGDLAQQLAEGLSTVDAVTLSRTLRDIEAIPCDTACASHAPVDLQALEQEQLRVQAELTRAILAGPASPRPSRERADSTRAEAPDPAAQAEFGYHAPRYLGLQKQMDARVPALRAQVRFKLSQGPRRLRQMAALDAAMELLVAPREQRLCAALPAHLDRRMAQLRLQHQHRQEASGLPDEPRRWSAPGGWLQDFEQDLQALLLAEMHMRLQPVLGLLEAARNDKNMEIQE